MVTCYASFRIPRHCLHKLEILLHRRWTCFPRQGQVDLLRANARPFCVSRPRSSALKDEPLRVLYCGSDSFSCASLKALHRESQLPSSNIASIDVVCREGKPYGRGLKSVRDRMCTGLLDRLLTNSSKRRSKKWQQVYDFQFTRSRPLLVGRFVYMSSPPPIFTDFSATEV
jgi:hypothetical protein